MPSVCRWLRRAATYRLTRPTGQSLTGASFTSVDHLKEHIGAFIETYNADAEPFVWTKSKVHQRRVKGRRLSDL